MPNFSCLACLEVAVCAGGVEWTGLDPSQASVTVRLSYDNMGVLRCAPV